MRGHVQIVQDDRKMQNSFACVLLFALRMGIGVDRARILPARAEQNDFFELEPRSPILYLLLSAYYKSMDV